MGKLNQFLNAAGRFTPIFLLWSLTSPTTVGSGTSPSFNHYGIRMAVYNTMMPADRDCVPIPDAGAVPTMPGPLPPSIQPLGEYRPTAPGILAIAQEPLPTEMHSAVITAPCGHLSTMQSHCTGTDFMLKYAGKSRMPTPRH